MTASDRASSVRGNRPSDAARMLCVAFTMSLAIACADSAPSGPYDSGIAPRPPIVVDTGAVPTGLLAVTNYPDSVPSRVYTLRPDGTGLTQLTPDDHSAMASTWSPDGSRIAYQRAGGDDVAGIWIIRADGSGATRIAAGGSSPFWLDDARIGFGCDAGVCVVGTDGSSPSELIAHQPRPGMTDESFVLSPNGSSFAFVRHIPDLLGDASRIYVMKRDGTSERALAPTTPSPRELYPSWSGDSKRIAFYSARYGIAVVDVGGGSPLSVSRRSEVEPDIGFGAPAWSPDGTRIVFGNNAREFYIANADGTGVIRRVRVTASPSSSAGWNARWSWTSR